MRAFISRKGPYHAASFFYKRAGSPLNERMFDMSRKETKELFKRFSIEVSAERGREIDERAKALGVSKNRVVNIALSQYFDKIRK